MQMKKVAATKVVAVERVTMVAERTIIGRDLIEEKDTMV